jgi:16S rRNA (adenine1518-N6/adenine1519-N6)-dimethyltransferase
LAWVRHDLDALRISPLKRFGQHFLLDKDVRDKLVDLAKISRDDTVLEIGAGLGFVTAKLASKGNHVIAIEKDRTLSKDLRRKFSSNRNVEVVEGDALKFPFPAGAKIVASPPYNISSQLTLRILSSQFKIACLLLQEDFVRRLTASNGSRDYGRITVMLQSKAEAKYIKKVPRESFYPRPKVDSALATISPISSSIDIQDPRIFEELVRNLFTQRRRKLRGVLSRYLQAKYAPQKNAILAEAGQTDKRVYELSPSEFITLSNSIADVLNKT